MQLVGSEESEMIMEVAKEKRNAACIESTKSLVPGSWCNSKRAEKRD